MHSYGNLSSAITVRSSIDGLFDDRPIVVFHLRISRGTNIKNDSTCFTREIYLIVYEL